ncbi:MAG: DEAD/DEAH box helicase [Clostridium paraputrificum]
MVVLKEEDIILIKNLIKKYTVLYIKKDFLKVNIKDEINEIEIKKGLGLANIMSCLEKNMYKKLSLEFATIISSIVDDKKIIKRCNDILLNLSIFTFTEVLKKRKDYNDSIIKKTGLTLFEDLYREELYSKKFAGKKQILNKFQLDICNEIEKVNNISVSAPTSIGKSFLMKKVILTQLYKSQYSKIVYLVPTRALINEVVKDLQNEIKNLEIEDKIFVTCSSDLNIDMIEEKGVFVLTQERLNQMCSNCSDIKISIDLLIVDEAQKISDDARGILLEYSIRRSREIWPNIKVFFISPLIGNPEVFLNNFKLKDNYSKHEKLSSVNQNVIKLEKQFRKSKIDIKYNEEFVGSFPFKEKDFNGIADKIAYVIEQFNNEGNSIIYCNIQSSTRKIANKLAGNISCSTVKNIKIKEFSDFLKNYICEEYDLSKLIEKGIAYHYSKLPTIVKMGIEDLAKDGLLKFVTCTSTLLEGINVQANNIYIYNAQKRYEPLSNLEFWNLSVRAGRMTNDLCGNIICIDLKNDWYDKRYSKRDIENVDFKKNEIINNELGSFDLYIAKKDEIRENKQNKDMIESYKNLESILVLEKMDGVNLIKEYSDKISNIESKIEKIVESNTVPKELLKRLIGIDIKSINTLWSILDNDYSNIEVYFLLNPFSEDADKRFRSILKGINNIFLKSKYSDKKMDAITITSMKWIREKSLREIIFYNGEPNGENSDNINEKIQVSLEYLDEIRYDVNRHIYAYQEILKEVLKKYGNEEAIEKLYNYSLYLEFGSAKKTTLELMALGIFREGAIILSNNIDSNDDLINELKKFNVDSLNVSEYMKRKIKEKINIL